VQEKEIPALMQQLDEARALQSPEARAVEKEIREMLAAHRERVASVGAPGWLLMTGELAEVRPLDDAGPLAATDPRKADAVTMKAREDARVRNALANCPRRVGPEQVAHLSIVTSVDHTAARNASELEKHCVPVPYRDQRNAGQDGPAGAVRRCALGTELLRGDHALGPR
jgi:hypothetical protein